MRIENVFSFIISSTRVFTICLKSYATYLPRTLTELKLTLKTLTASGLSAVLF